MPKKLSTNTKSVEARDRKAAVEKEKSAAEEKRKADCKFSSKLYFCEISI